MNRLTLLGAAIVAVFVLAIAGAYRSGPVKVGDSPAAVVARLGKPGRWIINRKDGRSFAILDMSQVSTFQLTAPQPAGESWAWDYPTVRVEVSENRVRAISDRRW